MGRQARARLRVDAAFRQVVGGSTSTPRRPGAARYMIRFEV